MASYNKLIVDFAEQVLNVGVEERDAKEIFPTEIWNKCGTQGLLGLFSRSDQKTTEIDWPEIMHNLESLGYACRDNGLSFAIGAQFLAGILPIHFFGSTAQKEKYLPKLYKGEWIIANAMTEAPTGSDIYNMQATAEKTGNNYTLSGEKNYASNAPVAHLVLAYVASDPEKKMLGGISSFILERENNDYSTSGTITKMGLRSCLMGNIIFNKDSVIPESQLLGKEGSGAMIFNKSMIWERIGLSAIHLGSLTRILEETIQFLKQRKVFGSSLSKKQVLAHKLVDIKIELLAARQLVYQAVDLLENKKPADELSSIVKVKVSELYKRSLVDILQLYGAAGYINKHEMERMMRDALASTIYSGTTEIQKNIIGRRMGLM